VGAVSESYRGFYFLSCTISPLVTEKKLFAENQMNRHELIKAWNGNGAVMDGCVEFDEL
jgi:hypothetical protein